MSFGAAATATATATATADGIHSLLLQTTMQPPRAFFLCDQIRSSSAALGTRLCSFRPRNIPHPPRSPLLPPLPLTRLRSPSPFHPQQRLSLLPACSLRASPLQSYSSDMTRNKIPVVEHIVLLRVKDGVPEEQAEAMVSAIRGLKTLPSVIHLTAGKNVSFGVDTDATSAFTHALHSRYYSKEDLETYANDPRHVEVINKYISPIVDERIALDWETELDEATLLSSPVGAVRLIAMKPRSGSDSHLIELLGGFQSRFPSITQVSFGINFSPRSKGYELGYLALLPNLQELSSLGANSEHIDVLESTIFPALEKYTVVDYSST